MDEEKVTYRWVGGGGCQKEIPSGILLYYVPDTESGPLIMVAVKLGLIMFNLWEPINLNYMKLT